MLGLLLILGSGFAHRLQSHCEHLTNLSLKTAEDESSVTAHGTVLGAGTPPGSVFIGSD